MGSGSGENNQGLIASSMKCFFLILIGGFGTHLKRNRGIELAGSGQMSSERQKQMSEFWCHMVTDPQTIKLERNWAQWVRIKFDALVEAGFSQDQALTITVSQLRTITNNNNVILGEIPDD